MIFADLMILRCERAIAYGPTLGQIPISFSLQVFSWAVATMSQCLCYGISLTKGTLESGQPLRRICRVSLLNGI